MKKYNQKNELIQVICNCCEKTIAVENNICKTAFFYADFSWGYFSEKDGRTDRWDLCEACYDKITESFKIKIQTGEKIVLMDN